MQKSPATGFIGRRLVRRLATDFGISSTVCPAGLFGTIMTSALVRRIDWLRNLREGLADTIDRRPYGFFRRCSAARSLAPSDATNDRVSSS